MRDCPSRESCSTRSKVKTRTARKEGDIRRKIRETFSSGHTPRRRTVLDSAALLHLPKNTAGGIHRPLAQNLGRGIECEGGSVSRVSCSCLRQKLERRWLKSFFHSRGFGVLNFGPCQHLRRGVVRYILRTQCCTGCSGCARHIRSRQPSARHGGQPGCSLA